MSRRGVVSALARVSAAIWLGSGVFLVAVAAPAAFSGAGDPDTAARVVGGMLSSWHWIAVVGPLIVLISDRFRRRVPLILVIVAVALANVQWLVDNRIQEIRAAAGGSVSALAADDPVRQRFGAMHGISMILMIGQLVCAAGTVASDRVRDE